MGRVNGTGIPAPAPLTGVAAGVPYVALRPARGRRRAPLVVAWHQLDPPRTGQAMAAALPLARLAAWRVYLGLPMTGARAPASGQKEFARPGARDVAGEPAGAVVEQAFAEFPAAVAALRGKLPLDDGPIGLLGEGAGAAVALLALAESEVPVRAAALVSPAVQPQHTVATRRQRGNLGGRWTSAARAGAGRSWSTSAARAGAGRLDFAARASEIAGRDPQPAVLLVTGAGAGDGEPAERLWHTLADRYRTPGRVALVIIPGLAAHSLAGGPGIGPAPQTPGAARADAVITSWLARHLTDAEP
jgi:dienelactone hydrolase